MPCPMLSFAGQYTSAQALRLKASRSIYWVKTVSVLFIEFTIPDSSAGGYKMLKELFRVSLGWCSESQIEKQVRRVYGIR